MQSRIILPKNRTTGEKKGRFNSVQVHGTGCSSSWQKTEGEVQSGNVDNENTWSCMQAVSLGILMFSGGGLVVDALRAGL